MSNANSIRLMTSNVLGNWKAGKIENRDDRMADIYLNVRPDIIALQEVSKRYRAQENNLFDLVSPVYREISTPAFNRAQNNSTPLLYQEGRFRILHYGYHFFQDGICDNSKSITWALFQERGAGKRFVYASTHFIHTSEDGRMIDGDQAKLVCDALVRYYGCPVFIGGDYNCGRLSPAYRHLILHGFLNLYDLAPNAPTIKSFHPYPEWDDEKRAYVASRTEADGDFNSSIDHIFYYGKEEWIPEVERYTVVTDENAKIASDHYPIYVDLVLHN